MLLGSARSKLIAGVHHRHSRRLRPLLVRLFSREVQLVAMNAGQQPGRWNSRQECATQRSHRWQMRSSWDPSGKLGGWSAERHVQSPRHSAMRFSLLIVGVSNPHRIIYKTDAYTEKSSSGSKRLRRASSTAVWPSNLASSRASRPLQFRCVRSARAANSTFYLVEVPEH